MKQSVFDPLPASAFISKLVGSAYPPIAPTLSSSRYKFWMMDSASERGRPETATTGRECLTETCATLFSLSSSRYGASFESLAAATLLLSHFYPLRNHSLRSTRIVHNQ